MTFADCFIKYILHAVNEKYIFNTFQLPEFGSTWMMTNRVHCLSVSSFLVFRQCLWSHLKIVLTVGRKVHHENAALCPRTQHNDCSQGLNLDNLIQSRQHTNNYMQEQEQLRIKLTSNKNNKREGEKKNVQTFSARDLFQLSTKSCDLMSCQLMKLWSG